MQACLIRSEACPHTHQHNHLQSHWCNAAGEFGLLNGDLLAVCVEMQDQTCSNKYQVEMSELWKPKIKRQIMLRCFISSDFFN